MKRTSDRDPLRPSRALTVTAPAGRTALAPLAVDGVPWDETQPHVLLAGVDTLYCSFDLPVSEAVWDRLAREQTIAQDLDAERHAVHCPEWLDAILRPHGAKGGYRFLIESEAWSIKLLRDVPHRPPIYVELRAFALHTHPEGVLGLCQALCTYLQDVLLADQDPATVCTAINVDVARCSRLDLHVDWQGGWHPTLAEGEHRLFVRPARVKWQPHLSGTTCTGYTFGKGHVQARVYNKSTRAREQQQDWYFALVEQGNGAAYQPSQDVWRLEFQLLRAGVTGFRLRATPELGDPDEVLQAELDAEDLPHLGTVRKALHWAGPVWRYLTTRWLRLVESPAMPSLCSEGKEGKEEQGQGDSNRARWREHPTWAVLREGFALATARSPLPEGQLTLVRAARHAGYQRLLDRMAVGVLTAADLYDSDPGAAVGSWLAYMHRLAQLIRRRQAAREAAWRACDRPERVADSRRGNGASLDRLAKVEQLLAMALGVFTSTGVVSAQLPHVGSVAELLCAVLDDLEALARDKGGIGLLLYEKRCKVYRATSARGLFTAGPRRRAS